MKKWLLLIMIISINQPIYSASTIYLAPSVINCEAITTSSRPKYTCKTIDHRYMREEYGIIDPTIPAIFKLKNAKAIVTDDVRYISFDYVNEKEQELTLTSTYHEILPDTSNPNWTSQHQNSGSVEENVYYCQSNCTLTHLPY